MSREAASERLLLLHREISFMDTTRFSTRVSMVYEPMYDMGTDGLRICGGVARRRCEVIEDPRGHETSRGTFFVGQLHLPLQELLLEREEAHERDVLSV